MTGPEPLPDVAAARPGGESGPVELRPRNLLGTTVSISSFRGVSVLAAALAAILSARELGPSGRGALVLLLTLAPFTAVVCGVGVNLAGRVHMVAAESPVLLGEYFGLTVVLAVFEMAVCALVGAMLLPVAGVHLTLRALVLFGLLGAVTLGQALQNDALNTFGFVVEAAAAETAGFVLQVALTLALVLVGERRFEVYAVVVTIAGVFQVLAGLRVLHVRGLEMRPRYSREAWSRLLRTGWPAIPSTLSQLLTFRVDRYIVGVFMTPAAVGVYSVAATVPEFLRIIPMALGQSAFFRVASRTARHSDFRRPLLACLAATVGLGTVVFLLAPVAVRVLFGPEFSGAITPLRILLLAEVAMTAFNIDGAILAGLGRLKDGAVVALIGLVLVLILDFVLIRSHGLGGAAWASVLAYSVMSVAAHVVLRWRTAGVGDGAAVPAT